MSDSSPSPGSWRASKPTPRFMSYREAHAQYVILADAFRSLSEALLEGDAMTPATRAKVLALRAVLDGRPDDGA